MVLLAELYHHWTQNSSLKQEQYGLQHSLFLNETKLSSKQRKWLDSLGDIWWYVRAWVSECLDCIQRFRCEPFKQIQAIQVYFRKSSSHIVVGVWRWGCWEDQKSRYMQIRIRLEGRSELIKRGVWQKGPWLHVFKLQNVQMVLCGIIFANDKILNRPCLASPGKS